MKKQALQDIIKQGEKAINSQISEFKIALQKHQLDAARGEIKNLRTSKNLKRSIKQLLSASTVLKIVKDQS